MKLASVLIVLLVTGLNLQMSAQAYETRSYDLGTKTTHATLSPAEQKEPAVILLDKRVYEYLYDKKGDLELYFTAHRHIHINDAAYVDNYNRIYLPVSDPDDLLSLRLRSVSKSGKIREMYKGDMKRITEEGNDYLILAIEGLEKDSELEYFYTTRRNVTYFISEWMQSGVYTRHSDFRLISPQNLLFEVKSYNGNVAKSDTLISDKRFLTISRDSTPVLDMEEKYSAGNANKIRVEFKLAKNSSGGDMRLFTWADAGNRFYQIMHAEEKIARKDIERLASSLELKKKKSPEDQIRTLENFMKTNVNNKSDGENPTIGGMLKKNYGSMNQITSLYILMFEYLNIPHEFVITTSRFNAQFDPDFDTWNYLDVYLIYFPTTGKYLDPVNYAYRYGLISYEYSGNNGLFIKKITIGDVSNGISSVKKIEATDFARNFDNMDVAISFENDMKETKIKMTRQFSGHSDNQIRAAYFYSDAENKEKIVDGLLESSVKDIKTKDAKLVNYDLVKDDYNMPLVMESTVTTTELIEKAADNVVFAIGMVIGAQLEMYQDHARQSPIDINFPHSYVRVLKVTIPEGYDVKGLEKLDMNIVYEDKGIGFVSSYKLDGKLLTVTINEYYKNIELPLSAYDDFKKVINAAADFNKIKLIFTKA